MKNKILHTIIISSLSLAGLAQCGKQNAMSEGITASFLPQSPIVVNSAYVFNRGATNEFTATAPWFKSSFRVGNDTGHRLYLLTFEYEAKGIKSGSTVTSTGTLDPSSMCSGTDASGATASRDYLAIIGDGETYKSLSDPCLPETPIGTETEFWVLSSLADTDNNSYVVKFTGVGFFTNCTTSDQSELDSGACDDTPLGRLVLTGHVYPH